jgi:hypothetical protein
MAGSWPCYLVLSNEPLAHGLRLLCALSVVDVAAVLVTCGGVLFARHDLG